MQDVHREEPIRPIDEELEHEGEEDTLKEGDACEFGRVGPSEGGGPRVAQRGRGGRARAHASPLQTMVLPLRAGQSKNT